MCVARLCLMQSRVAETLIALLDAMPDAAMIVVEDRRVTKAVIHNLLSNAIQFTPPRGSMVLDSTVGGGHAVTIRFPRGSSNV